MVTRRKKWSTSLVSGWPKGSSLVVQVSGGALARISSVAPSIKIKSNFRGYKRVDTIFRAGPHRPALFLGSSSFLGAGLSRHMLFAMSFRSRSREQRLTDLLDDAADAMAPSNLIQCSFELAAERCEDLTPLVYRRLFGAYPEAEAMFRSEGKRSRQGLDAGARHRGDAGFRRRTQRTLSTDRMRVGLPRRLRYATKTVRRIFRRDRRHPAANF